MINAALSRLCEIVIDARDNLTSEPLKCGSLDLSSVDDR